MSIKKNLAKLGMSEFVATLDIESLGTDIDMKIATIGCTVISLLTGKVKATFYVRINLDQPDRTETKSTLDWWENQREESPFAYDEVFNTSLMRISLKDALNNFNDFLLLNMDKRPLIIGNDNSFDNSAVKHAMKSINIKPIWDHGCDQSLRTAVMFGRILLGLDPKYKLEFKGHQHHALDDSLHEAKYLYSIIKAFEERLF